MPSVLRTNISNAYWCAHSGIGMARRPDSGTDARADRKKPDYFKMTSDFEDQVNTISWFDHLFNGGIVIPETHGKPLLMLVSGPPGSGKTTLALELCIRVALIHDFWSLYISTESETRQLLKKAAALGIKGSNGRIVSFSKKIDNPRALTLYGQENIKKWETFTEILEAAITDVTEWLKGSKSKLVTKLLEHYRVNDKVKDVSPDILVFDNLNLIKPEERRRFFERIVTGRYGKTKLIIVILDSLSASSTHEAWEFACDIIIRLDYSTISLDSTSLRDYYLRQIEVIKARYQAHVWGKHQLKIYAPSKFKIKKGKRKPDERIKRAHPFREEGGIFVYPSIHLFLSEYKKRGNTMQRINAIPTPLDNLNKLMKGFPEGRCTAFIGSRGGHKSHLGYLHLLNRILRLTKRTDKVQDAGIIISLRDDESMTQSHLTRILTEEYIRREKGEVKRKQLENKAEVEINRILESSDLEILYFPPGYITADEFFHRMFMSVYRLRDEGRRISLLFNSLDQLSARFPLCEHQPIFVPGMIEALSGEKVTSIFIAVDEPGQPQAHYGLLPMADLILRFDRYAVSQQDYFTLHGRPGKTAQAPKGGKFEKHRECVFLEVSRYAGGKQAGTKGLLELVYSDEKSESIITEPGLHFNKWDFNYSKPL